MKRSMLAVPSVLASLLAAVVLVGCAVDPGDVAELETAAPLPGSIEELDALAEEGTIAKTTPGSIDAANVAFAERVSAAELRIRAAAASRPDGDRLLAVITPASGASRTEDGNYRVTIQDAEVGEREVTTLGESHTAIDLAAALDGMDSAETQLAAYAAIYDGLDPVARDRLGAASPDSLDGAPTRVIRAAIERLAAHPDLLGSLVSPPDVGEPPKADNGGLVCNPSAASGILFNYSFPLKSSLPSVKNQGNRGTCASFAITSAVETARVVGGNNAANYSEQDFYYRNKAQWNGLTNYGDGLSVSIGLDSAKNQVYHFPTEASWPYNPSNSRVDLTFAGVYTLSCSGYSFTLGGIISNYCSDTAHQGGQMCVGSTCFYSSPVGSGTGSRVSSTFDMWTSNSTGLTLLKTYLSLKKGLVASITLPYSFKTPAVGGYVNAISIEPTIGTHAMQVVGAIDNAQLAITRPGAPAGSGGGYVMFKNSWGSCYADGGYVYLSYDTVMSFVYAVRVVDVVN